VYISQFRVVVRGEERGHKGKNPSLVKWGASPGEEKSLGIQRMA